MNVLDALHAHCLTLAPFQGDDVVQMIPEGAPDDPSTPVVQCEVWQIDSGIPQKTLAEADAVFRRELARMAADGDAPVIWIQMPSVHETPDYGGGVRIAAMVAVRGVRTPGVPEFMFP